MFVVAMAGGGARRAARPVHLAGHEGQEHQGGLRIGGKMISCSASRAACAVYPGCVRVLSNGEHAKRTIVGVLGYHLPRPRVLHMCNTVQWRT